MKKFLLAVLTVSLFFTSSFSANEREVGGGLHSTNLISIFVLRFILIFARLRAQ